MGPEVRRCNISSQLRSRKNKCDLTRPAPPLMFPSLRERSTVQKEQIMSLAWWEIGASAGKVMGFSTILQQELGTPLSE